MGWRSLRYVKAGSENTAIGVGTIEFSDSAYHNTSIGRGAMIAIGGKYNTVMGYYAAGDNNGTPTSNYYMNEVTSIGSFAGFRNTGNQNTFIGSNSGYGVTDTLTGIENTGLGAYTLTYNTSGKSNTGVGLGALYGNQTGNGNVAVGTRAMANGGTYSYNIAIGDSAMYGNNANENMAIGTKAMWFNNTGTPNTAVGNYAMQGNSTGSFNTALGYQALFNVNGNGNTALGHTAGNTITTGTFNTLLGYNSDVTGAGLTNASAIGAYALVNQSNSLVLGSISGINGATASTSVGIGTTTPANSKLEVLDNITPSRNAAYISGNNTTTIGSNGATLYVENLVTTGAGTAALLAENENTTAGLGYGAYIRGQWALAAEVTARATANGNPTKGLYVRNNTTNTGTHYGIDLAVNAVNATTAYGTFSTATGGSSTNTGVYGSSSAAATTNYGVYGTASGATNNYGVYCSGSGGYTGTWTLISDQKFKKDLNPLDNVLALLNKVNVYSYNTKNEEFPYMNFSKQLQFGYVAQDLEKYFPNLVEQGSHPGANADDAPITFKSVNYIGMVPVLTKAIQEQQQQIDELKKQNELLIKRLEKLENK